MIARSGGRTLAVLETSFWIASHRAEIAANCLDLFDLIVPRTVESEIRAPQLGAPHREYPYATLFRHLRDKMTDPPDPGPHPLPLFGAGEAEAIALAAHLRVRLLINERPAAQFAGRMGVACFTVPSLIVVLRTRDIISARAARRKLALIESITARTFLDEARRALDSL
jgi:hypothetical protein